jgi:hypothetical protein
VPGRYAGRRIESVDPGGAVSATLPPERAIGCVVYAATEFAAPGAVRHLEGVLHQRAGPDRVAAVRRAQRADDRRRTQVPRRTEPDLADDTLHVQENEIVKVTAPHDNPVTHGNLCIKGRFGCQHVQNRV